MDIWAWVFDLRRQLHKDGHERLAELIGAIPDAACEEQHARADALLPEALALARGLELPWLELYFRHWGLQSRVLHRAQGEPALAEAVSLLEFSHRPETAECPQSVCAVQDLAACYGKVDRHGYAEERIAVSTEALRRIDPSWPCFTCISGELASALVDADQLDEAKRFLDRQIAALNDIGEALPFNLGKTFIDVLIRLGKLEDALETTEQAAKDHELTESQRLEHALDRARTLARLGRTKEALDILPSYDDIVGTPGHYLDWSDAVSALIKQGALPADGRWRLALRSLADTMHRQGAYGGAYHLLVDSITSALEKERPAAAAITLAAAETIARKLRKPERARAELDELRRRVTAAPAAAPEESFASPDALIASLAGLSAEQQPDFERAFEQIAAGRRRWPEHRELAMHEAGCLLQLGASTAAIERLCALKGEDPTNTQVLGLLAEVYLNERQDDALVALAAEARPVDPTLGHWMLARLDHAKGRDAECIEHLREVLKTVPDAINSRKLWVQAARRLGDFRSMKERLVELIALEPEGQQHHWDCMVAATMDGDWDRVRQSASALGMKLEGTGPIDRDGELVRVRFTDKDGDFHIRYAVRNGPVTARIVQPSLVPPDYFRDVVVFDPAPLDQREEAPEGRAVPRLYAVVATLTRGKYRIFAVDGVHPGEAAWTALEKQMEELGCDLQSLSSDEYQLRDPDTHRVHPAICGALAIPETLDAAVVHRRLEQTTASFALPLTWAGCAHAAGDDVAAKRHHALLARWGGRESDASDD